MRRFIVIIGVLAIVASATALASGGKQQEVASKIRAELNKIDARLKLSADQKSQVRTLLTEQSDKLDELYAEIEPKETAIRDEYRGKIRDVLTPAQQAEWDKIKGEYREKWTGQKSQGKSGGKSGSRPEGTSQKKTENTSGTSSEK